MDTAAAAAAAVVVDLSAESTKTIIVSTSSLLSKPKSIPSVYPASVNNSSGSNNSNTTLTTCDCEAEGGECLGSTVEAMSATPPPTPVEQRKVQSTEGHTPSLSSSPSSVVAVAAAAASALSMETAEVHCHISSPAVDSEFFGLIAAQLTTSTSTSSTNASTTPTSALHTACTSTTSSVAATAKTPTSNGSGNTSSNSSGTHSLNGRSVGLTAKPMAMPIPEQLLQWQDMPKYLQFNPYVLKGYRPLQTFRGCLLSLFYWHNETVNILTHAIPIVYILAIVPGLMPWDKGYGFLSFCHVFGSVAPWCGSFVYHLFMNIEKGENVYYTLLKLDMVGIWVSQSFGALPLVTATTLCFTPILKWFIIISYCLLSLWGLYKALTASSPWQRRLCFALPFCMRSVLTFLRIRGLMGGSHMALSHVYLQDGVSILGGAIGAMRIPEKWFPGVVDFYLNSHNIMHVLVVVAVYSMHKATIKDFEWMSTQTCNSYGNITDHQSTLGHVEL